MYKLFQDTWKFIRAMSNNFLVDASPSEKHSMENLIKSYLPKVSILCICQLYVLKKNL